jgi:hypothetical protein
VVLDDTLYYPPQKVTTSSYTKSNFNYFLISDDSVWVTWQEYPNNGTQSDIYAMKIKLDLSNPNILAVKDNQIPVKDFSLSQNYPNPFNPSTTINYSIAKAGNIKLTVYNTIGDKVFTLVDGYKATGNYSVQFNGSNLASGIYLYQLKANDFIVSKKMLLLK